MLREDRTESDREAKLTSTVIESAIREISQGNERVEAALGETVSLSKAIDAATELSRKSYEDFGLHSPHLYCIYSFQFFIRNLSSAIGLVF